MNRVAGVGVAEGAERLRLAALLTCHNRRQLTLGCLANLRAAQEVASKLVEVKVFLVDDGSADGTAPAVRQEFPEVRLIDGDGTLYWCGGMRLAWREAAREQYDGFLWLNDDVRLDPDALVRLVDTLDGSKDGGSSKGIVVGAVRPVSPREAHEATYGALGEAGVLPAASEAKQIELFNGNVVLVLRAAFETLGSLSAAYIHGLADVEYGIRAKRAGVSVWLAAGTLGTCQRNPTPRWMRRDVSLWERLRALHSPTGCPPLQMARLILSDGGWWFPWSIVKLYMKVLSPPRFH